MKVDELTPEERAAQHRWAQRQCAMTGPYVEGYDWASVIIFYMLRTFGLLGSLQLFLRTRVRVISDQACNPNLNPNPKLPCVHMSWLTLPQYRVKGGYNCYGGMHFISNKLLKEGKGGFYRYCSSFYGLMGAVTKGLGLARDNGGTIERSKRPYYLSANDFKRVRTQ